MPLCRVQSPLHCFFFFQAEDGILDFHVTGVQTCALPICDSAASLMTCEPILMRPQWGAFGRAPAALSACVVHPLAIARDLPGELGLSKKMLPVGATRGLSKRDMLWNDVCPKISVDPETFDVFVDGVLATCEPARKVPLARRYMLR